MGRTAEDPIQEAERRIADVARAHGSNLDLARLGLIAIPDSIRQLTALTTLDLSDNQLTAIPDWIGQLTALTTLDLSDNQLTAIPDSIRQLTALTTLSLSDNQLTAIPRLYVSAPGDLDLRPLLDGLKRRGTEPYVLSDVASLGADIVQSLRMAIETADRVLVVLDEEPALNPVFEAGIAVALGKPVLVIAAPGALVPSDLTGQLITQARPDDLDAINYALDHAEARSSLPARPIRMARPTGVPLGPAEVDRLLSRLRSYGPTETDSIAVLLEAIEASGGVGAVSTGHGTGFDLGVWSDDLDAIGGNPLLVEVKRSLTRGAVDQALHALTAHPTARLALLVYLDPSPAEQRSLPDELDQARFPVLVISLQQLLLRMTSASFAEVVRDMRNRSSHGLGPS